MPNSKKKVKGRKLGGATGTGTSSWPLPPSSVFRCRPAKPWVNPELFYTDYNYYPHSSSSGVILIGEVTPEPDLYENESDDIYLKYDEAYTTDKPNADHEPIYADPVELKGPSDRLIEYSANPEKGIDVGDLELEGKQKTKMNPLLERLGSREEDWEVHREEELNREVLIKLREEAGYGELGKIVKGTGIGVKHSNGRKRKTWTPFQKNQKQSWKLFY